MPHSPIPKTFKWSKMNQNQFCLFSNNLLNSRVSLQTVGIGLACLAEVPSLIRYTIRNKRTEPGNTKCTVCSAEFLYLVQGALGRVRFPPNLSVSPWNNQRSLLYPSVSLVFVFSCLRFLVCNLKKNVGDWIRKLCWHQRAAVAATNHN